MNRQQGVKRECSSYTTYEVVLTAAPLNTDDLRVAALNIEAGMNVDNVAALLRDAAGTIDSMRMLEASNVDVLKRASDITRAQ